MSLATLETQIEPISAHLDVDGALDEVRIEKTVSNDAIDKLNRRGERISNISIVAGALVFFAMCIPKTFMHSDPRTDMDRIKYSFGPLMSYSTIRIAGRMLSARYFRKASKLSARSESQISETLVKNASNVSDNSTADLVTTNETESINENRYVQDLHYPSIRFRADDIPAQRQFLRRQYESAIEGLVHHGIHDHFEFLVRRVRNILIEEYTISGADVEERLALFDEHIAKKRKTLLDNKRMLGANKTALSSDEDLTGLASSLSGDVKMPDGKILAPGILKKPE